MNTFGDYISRLRNYSKMTQEQLAEEMEVSKTTIQNWESGRTKVKPAHLKRLAYLFNVPETTLITEMNRENDSRRDDVFPYFLFEDDDELIGIIQSLHLALHVLNGLSSITTVRYDKSCTPIRWYLEINDLGRRLLRWFREKE